MEGGLGGEDCGVFGGSSCWMSFICSLRAGTSYSGFLLVSEINRTDGVGSVYTYWILADLLAYASLLGSITPHLSDISIVALPLSSNI